MAAWRAKTSVAYGGEQWGTRWRLLLTTEAADVRRRATARAYAVC